MYLYSASGRSAGFRSFIPSLLLAFLCTTPGLQAQDLTAEQQQKVAAVESGLKRVQTNYQLAADSAGTGIPTGSKAKLSKMRLDTAAADLPQLKQWLSELPAEQPQVQQLAGQFAAIEQNIQQLDDRIAGKSVESAAVAAAPPTSQAAPQTASSPTATGATTAATPATTATAPAAAAVAVPAADAAVKLGYQQEDILKGARFNLTEVQGNAQSLTQSMTELQAIDDQLGIDYRQVQGNMNTLENARRKAGFTQDGLNKLPPNGQGVAETAAELSSANAKLDAAQAYFAPLHQQLTELVNPANYPDLPADLKRLNELSAMYRDTMLLQNNREQAAAVFQQADAAKTEAVRIAQAYLPLMVQQTEEGKRVEGAGNSFLGNLAEFQAAADLERQNLPAEIRTDLDEADRIAREAVAQQKPLFFTGGVPQHLAYANDRLALYQVLDPQQGPAMEKEVRSREASLQKSEQSLSQLIIQQNELPPDRYTGPDRAKAIEVATDAWTYQQKDFKVLASRIPAEAWLRETLWQYSNGTWYYVDRSKLQVQLIVADEKNDQQAVILPINIWKDHQKGDSMIGTPLYSGDEKLQPSSYMLRDKVK